MTSPVLSCFMLLVCPLVYRLYFSTHLFTSALSLPCLPHPVLRASFHQSAHFPCRACVNVSVFLAPCRCVSMSVPHLHVFTVLPLHAPILLVLPALVFSQVIVSPFPQSLWCFICQSGFGLKSTSHWSHPAVRSLTSGSFKNP